MTGTKKARVLQAWLAEVKFCYAAITVVTLNHSLYIDRRQRDTSTKAERNSSPLRNSRRLIVARVTLS